MVRKTKVWLQAMRLRTLPLSLSCVALGSFLAVFNQQWNPLVLVLSLVTTLFLQILSNLANDYGDSANGADNAERIGPERAVQSGSISPSAMRKAIAFVAFLALSSGTWLIVEGTKGLSLSMGVVFFVLGLGAIVAAIKYTAGKNPYGYRGFGDLFVFLFFGWVGVMGTYFLHAHSLRWELLLPASSIGLLSVGVLNLNNMRDRESDKRAGKITLPVRLGTQNAKIYHVAIIVSAIVLSLAFVVAHYRSPLQLIFLITLPLLALNIKAVMGNKRPQDLDPQLKKLAMTTFLFAITLGTGLIL